MKSSEATAGVSPARHALRRWLQQEDLNFLLTNRVPRITLTRLMGWYSRIRSPRLTRWSIALWRRFTDLDLSEAAESQFDSLHACFTRALKPGARPVDDRPGQLCSPSDGIVGACGPVQGTHVFQAKGFPYALKELFGGDALADELCERYRDGSYVTLRLTSAMYHRFHAPQHGRLRCVSYISGDTWNVNPIALRRVERLFCRNERAVLPLELDGGDVVTLVPVAAILVASLRLHALPQPLNLRYRGPNLIGCDARFATGDELGWFEHGSTIIVFAPAGYRLAPGVQEGAVLRMGQPLMRTPNAL